MSPVLKLIAPTTWKIGMLVVAMGCTGQIGDADKGTNPEFDPQHSDIPDFEELLNACDGVSAQPLQTFRRVSATQFATSVAEVINVTRDAVPSIGDPDITLSGSFTSYRSVTTATSDEVRNIHSAVEMIVSEALSSNGGAASVSGCEEWNDACVRDFTSELLSRAFRRAPTQGEVDATFQVYTDAKSDSRSFESAITALLETSLLSPQFLFFGAVQVEAQRGLAERLSYLLTDSPPDAELLALVEAGALMEQLESETRRLFLSDAGARAFGGFLIDYGLIDRAAGGKDPELYPNAGVTLLEDQREELIRFAVHVVQNEGASLEALFTSNAAFPNERIAASTGMPMGAEAFARVDLPAEQGVGLLTRPAVLAAISGYSDPSIVRRGVWVRSQLLCKDLEPPPFIPPIVQMEGESEEEAFDRHKSDPGCAGCHQLIDPIGEGFAAFDSVGRWDASTVTLGEIAGVDDAVDGEFTSVRELGEKLASTDIAKDCMAVQWYRHAVARHESTEDDCEVLKLREAIRASGSLEDMVVAYVTNPGFTGAEQ